MKTYLKKSYNVEDVVNDLKKLKNVQFVDKGTFYMGYYNDPVNDMNNEVVKINKVDSRVLFSATSTLFKDKLKNMVDEM